MVYVKMFKELLNAIVHLLIKDPFAQVIKKTKMKINSGI